MNNKIKEFILGSVFWIVLLSTVFFYGVKSHIVTLFTNKPRQRVNFFE